MTLGVLLGGFADGWIIELDDPATERLTVTVEDEGNGDMWDQSYSRSDDPTDLFDSVSFRFSKGRRRLSNTEQRAKQLHEMRNPGHYWDSPNCPEWHKNHMREQVEAGAHHPMCPVDYSQPCNCGVASAPSFASTLLTTRNTAR